MISNNFFGMSSEPRRVENYNEINKKIKKNKKDILNAVHVSPEHHIL